MPRRRPPRAGHVVNNYNLLVFAAAVLFLPWLVDAQQQQQSHVVPQRHSPHEGLEPEASHTLEATKIPPQVQTPYSQRLKKETRNDSNNNRKVNKNDASAIATLAPANTAVAAPPARRSSITSAGLTSPHTARSLGDWEVEDFVLLATVDGTLYATDRITGNHRWSFTNEKPMVETKHYRRARSEVEEDYDAASMDDYMWIVEPSRDGSLYLYRPPGGPNPGLVNTGHTMKNLVENLAPHGSEDPPVMYTGEKKTQMMTVDANTGTFLKYFGSQAALFDGQGNCLNQGFPVEECTKNSTLTIGRTEYTVGIQDRNDGHQIATLKFFEWSPNTYDDDLQRQYHTTPDSRYVYTSHDGGYTGVDHGFIGSNDQPRRMFHHSVPSPVVRVFDVARPWQSDKINPDLIILPQPLPPLNGLDIPSSNQLASSIVLNHTDDGSWFAMSGSSYPMAVDGSRQAEIMQKKLTPHPWDLLNNSELTESLVGRHSIDQNPERFLTISPPGGDIDEKQVDLADDNAPALVADPTILEQVQKLPGIAAHNLRDFVMNPMSGFILLAFILSYQRQIRAWVGRYSGNKHGESMLESPIPSKATEVGQLPKIPENEVLETPAIEAAVEAEPALTDEAATAKEEVAADGKDAQIPPVTVLGPEDPAPTPKRKSRRGQRGGVKHKKGGKGAFKEDSSHSQDGTLPKPPQTVEEVVRDVQKLGEPPKLEPDIHTVANDPSEVSGPILRMGALEVNTEKLIGTGSNGTMVFEGNFDGREVAVKRMLIQFFDIASQETKLLRESDDHPNVIRYYAQQQAAGFLYIALELCPASLADVIEKPHLHRALAHGGEQDLPNVLYQITNGLHHLHTLRIVHRDLKPQNILVSMGKDKRPRLLVSDFGLCKKLDSEQSSFRATTAHAAGTSGWRAPELLLDDDANHANEGTAMVDASTDGGSSSALVSSDIMPGNRRATRAIDIFSLGLVFFYVLTKGSHPFDCGDRYMREVNIRKGQYDLSGLSVYGEYGLEAEDLIGSMLSPEPKRRPSAREVMAHPFFWSPKKRLNFLCDVSDHFEKEKRDPPTFALEELERSAPNVVRGDFLKWLSKDFVDSMGKQRKYTGSRLLDLLRALRNKKNHYEDMTDKLKKEVGPLPEGYLSFWTLKFPNLLINCWNLVYELRWDETDRFREYYNPAGY
ncbi:Serine/threonine-protein kinase ppk4 [Lachnellula suecica]|uniref:non-specific serine/threonine protein kinase n=1 Tax=Lachnellula suecica TaxID=602035 RepID=A0A8T9CB81_9HELO|nr:Serine/threonine-protein kinase ppk4 [Lachnellula suecica]